MKICKKVKLYLETRFWEISLLQENHQLFLHRSYGMIGKKVIHSPPRRVESERKGLTYMNAEIKKKKLIGFTENLKERISRGSVFGPMGAHKLDDYEHKLIYPVIVQRKLDGFRCIARFDDAGKVVLYSKSMKPFSHLNHIKTELEERFSLRNVSFDGELYSHGLPLNEISKLVMKKRELTSEEEEASKKIVYMVFDTILENVIFEERYHTLVKLFEKKKSKYVQLVKCEIAKSKEEVYDLNQTYLVEGYEGVIVRNKKGLYIYKKKSYDVLRTKEFKHGLFTILGGKEGEGTYRGTLIWELKCDQNNSRKSFYAIQMGALQDRRSIFEKFQKNPKDFIGKMVKVKYLKMDDYGCVLRNPIVEGFASSSLE
jgi:ATP-dependent DNA ligase